MNLVDLLHEDLLTLEAAGRLYNCSGGTVRNWIVQGDRETGISLEATVMPSGRLKTSKQALERFFARIRKPAGSEP